MAVHQLQPARQTTADVFSPEHEAVLTVDPGDTVVAGALAGRSLPSMPTPRPLA